MAFALTTIIVTIIIVAGEQVYIKGYGRKLDKDNKSIKSVLILL